MKVVTYVWNDKVKRLKKSMDPYFIHTYRCAVFSVPLSIAFYFKKVRLCS